MPNSGRPRFGELEHAVLDVLWTAAGEADDRWLTVREVHEHLARGREVAYTTVMTVLDRLARKGLVDRERQGRAHTYRARASRAGLTAELLRETLDEVAADDPAGALVAFVGEASEDELAALRRALGELERGRVPR